MSKLTYIAKSVGDVDHPLEESPSNSSQPSSISGSLSPSILAKNGSRPEAYLRPEVFPSATKGSALVDVFVMTLWETLAYHVWAFWGGRALGNAVKLMFFPFALLPPTLQGVLTMGTAQIVWVRLLSSRHPKELEAVFLRHLRNRHSISAELLLKVAAVVIGLFSFTHLWSLFQRVSEETHSSWEPILFAPVLPFPRSPKTGQPIQLKLDEDLIGCLLTEYVLSMFHYYGVGLATLLKPKGVRGLLTFRLFVSPMLAAVGKQGLTGAPSLNSSVAIISAIKNQSVLPLFLALMDLTALASVVLVPRIFRHGRNEMLCSLTKLRGLAQSESMPPRTFKKSQDKTLYQHKAKKDE